MYNRLVLPVEGSVTFASRPQNFCVCCFQAVGLLLYVAPPMCFSDFSGQVSAPVNTSDQAQGSFLTGAKIGSLL
jgi:hypothetical protein